MSFHQDINLFLPIFKKVEVPFSGKTILQGSIIIAAALVAIFVFANIQLTIQKSRLSSMQNQESEMQMQIEELTDQKNSRNADAVYREVEKLGIELDAQRALIRRLGNFKGANRSGFSNYMAEFSNQHIEGLWLEQFSILNGGEVVTMAGKSVKASFVPNYVGKLKRQPIFKSTDFGLIKLESQSDEVKDILGFTLAREKNSDG